MNDIKILGLVLIGLFVLFFISGGITGMGIGDLLGFGDKTCVKLTEEQCDKVCGGVVYSKRDEGFNEKGCGSPTLCDSLCLSLLDGTTQGQKDYDGCYGYCVCR